MPNAELSTYNSRGSHERLHVSEPAAKCRAWSRQKFEQTPACTVDHVPVFHYFFGLDCLAPAAHACLCFLMLRGGVNKWSKDRLASYSTLLHVVPLSSRKFSGLPRCSVTPRRGARCRKSISGLAWRRCQMSSQDPVRTHKSFSCHAKPSKTTSFGF